MAAPCPVLYVNHVSQISGAEESLLALMARLDRERFVPHLACPPGELAVRAKQSGVEIVVLPMTRFHRTANPLKVSSYAVSWVIGTNHLRRVVGELKPRIIHSNSANAHIYVSSIAEKQSIPCVWHSRDLRHLPLPALTLCRGADKVIAISEAVVEFLAASGLTRPKVTRIYNGISPKDWSARVTGKDVRAELGIASDERIVLMAAQLAPWKRHEDALRMMPHILAKAPRTRLLLAGSDLFSEHPELSDGLRRLAMDLQIAERTLFLGQRADIPNLMAAADVVVIPSDAEPFGRVAIEAMSLGKPVVGTRSGGLPEVVRDGETGLLVVPRFPESLGLSCLRILENQSLARALGEAGKRRAETHFNIDQTAEETQTLYENMLHPPLKWIR